MKIRRAALYQLELPLAQPFSHSAKRRTVTDTVIVRVESDHGVVGYGEGLPRPYVTGETVSTAMACLQSQIWPAIRDTTFRSLRSVTDLILVSQSIPTPTPYGVVAWHASRCAMELAVIDCLLREADIGLGQILPPRRPVVRYSGVIGLGDPTASRRLAAQMALNGLSQIKVKVGRADDQARLAVVRDECGPDTSLRIDANGAWTAEEAAASLPRLEPYRLDAVEEPIARGDPAALGRLRRQIATPVMVDESLVTQQDALALIQTGACDIFNIRLSKCGGLGQTLAIAQLARIHGLQVQVGAQVGETAILSAVGRHVAAALEEVRFVEGSFGTHLLTQDISQEAIAFGYGGEATVLTGPGYGITVQDAVLQQFATRVVQLSREGP